MSQDAPPDRDGGFQWGEDRPHEASTERDGPGLLRELQRQVDELRSELADTEAIADQVDHLRGRLDELAASQLEADAVVEQVDALEAQLDELHETVGDASAGAAPGEIDRIESEIEDFRQTLQFVLDLVTAPPDASPPVAEE